MDPVPNDETLDTVSSYDNSREDREKSVACRDKSLELAWCQLAEGWLLIILICTLIVVSKEEFDGNLSLEWGS